MVHRQNCKRGPDLIPFAAFPELTPCQLFAGDGHWHAAAAHDPRDHNGTKHATGHVYLQNLRTKALLHLDLCDPIHKRKEHDISVIKRATLDALRGGTPKGTPVILVWDRAIIDYRFLRKVKDQGGLYFATRPKSNSNLTRSGINDIAPIPVNEGVLSDELVAPVGCWKSSQSISPAISAAIRFLCLLHNLMVLFEAGLAETGISNAAEEKRREKVLTERTERVEKTFRKMPLIIAGFQRLTQRTVKSIRWLRSFFWHNRPLDELRLILKKRYATL